MELKGSVSYIGGIIKKKSKNSRKNRAGPWRKVYGLCIDSNDIPGRIEFRTSLRFDRDETVAMRFQFSGLKAVFFPKLQAKGMFQIFESGGGSGVGECPGVEAVIRLDAAPEQSVALPAGLEAIEG
ncbi:MAG: hypothetical protein V3U53_09780, partial [bacterium]